MKLVVIFGPSAVGKMTVGYELQKVTDYKLFHNHMIMEPIYNFWGYADEQLKRLTSEFRNRLFEEFGKSGFTGIIFTYVWALDEEYDHKELLSYIDKMAVDIKDVLFVELQADQDVRVGRNKTDFRLREKRSKNNLKESELFIYKSEEAYKLNSNDDFFYPNQHIKIDNTNLEPCEVASLIKEEMGKRNMVPSSVLN